MNSPSTQHPFNYALLPAVIFIPILGYTVAGTSSMSTGVILVMAMIAALSAPALWEHRRVCVAVCAVLAAALSAHALVASSQLTVFDWNRFASGTAGALILVLACFAVAQAVTRSESDKVHAAVYFILALMAINACLGIIGADLGLRTSAAPVGFYSEPSHLAVQLAPVLLFLAVKKRPPISFAAIGVFLFWAAMSKSLVGLAIVFAICIIAVRWNWKTLLAAAASAAAAIAVMGPAYLAPRLNLFSIANGNASSWVLVRGWEDAWHSLLQTNGVGQGFQQFGNLSADGPAQQALRAQGREWINVLDGGTTAPKIIGEFGLMGVVIVIALLAMSAVAVFKLRTRTQPAGSALLLCFVAALPVELFLRGAGYFTPTFALSCAGIVALLWDKQVYPQEHAAPLLADG